MVQQKLRLLGTAATITYTSLMVLSGVTISGLFVTDSPISCYGVVVVQCVTSLTQTVAHAKTRHQSFRG